MTGRARSSTIGTAILAVFGIGMSAVACFGFAEDRAQPPTDGDFGACSDDASRVTHPSAEVLVAQLAAGTHFEVIGCGVAGHIEPCGDRDLDRITDGDAREDFVTASGRACSR